MKKVIILGFCLVLSLAFFQVKTVKAATEAYDQRCIIGAGEGGYTDIRGASEEVQLNQTFTPTKNRLTKISLYLKGTATGNFHIDLYHNDNFIASTPSEPEPNGSFYVSQSFSQPVAVTPGDGNYKIIPRKSGDNISLFWYVKLDCYDGGIAYVGNNPFGDSNYDFGFVTFGYNATATDDSVDNSQAADLDQSQLQDTNSPASQTQDQNTSQGKIAQKEQKALSFVESMPLWQKIFFSVGTLLVLAGIGYLIYRAVKRRKERNHPTK